MAKNNVSTDCFSEDHISFKVYIRKIRFQSQVHILILQK